MHEPIPDDTAAGALDLFTELPGMAGASPGHSLLAVFQGLAEITQLEGILEGMDARQHEVHTEVDREERLDGMSRLRDRPSTQGSTRLLHERVLSSAKHRRNAGALKETFVPGVAARGSPPVLCHKAA